MWWCRRPGTTSSTARSAHGLVATPDRPTTVCSTATPPPYVATVAAVCSPAARSARFTTARLRGGRVSGTDPRMPASLTAEIVTSRGSSVLLNIVTDVLRSPMVGPPGQNQLVESSVARRTAPVCSAPRVARPYVAAGTGSVSGAIDHQQADQRRADDDEGETAGDHGVRSGCSRPAAGGWLRASGRSSRSQGWRRLGGGPSTDRRADRDARCGSTPAPAPPGAPAPGRRRSG